MEVKRYVMGIFATNTYILCKDDKAIVIDPAGKADQGQLPVPGADDPVRPALRAGSLVQHLPAHGSLRLRSGWL